MVFSLVPPFSMPTLDLFSWETNSRPVSGQAAAVCLSRLPVAQIPHRLFPNRWLKNTHPHAWTQDMGFEDDVIAPTPTCVRGKPTQYGTPILARFADKTTLFGWEHPTVTYWCPFPMINTGALPAPDNIASTITTFINAIPPLLNDQRVLKSGYSLRPYMTCGKAPKNVERVEAILGHLREKILARYNTIDRYLLTVSLYGRHVKIDQTWSLPYIAVHGADNVNKTSLEPLLEAYIAALLNTPDLTGLQEKDYCFCQRQLFVAGAQQLAKATNETKPGSAHLRLEIEKAISTPLGFS